MRIGRLMASVTRWILVLKPPRERPIAALVRPLRPGGVLVSAHDRGVDLRPLPERIRGEHRERALPHALAGPAPEANEDAVPGSEALRQVAPACPVARLPEHGLDKE